MRTAHATYWNARHEAHLRSQAQHRLRLHEKRGPVTTLRISDELNVDIAPDGMVYGFELLNANAQLTEDQGELVVELAGREQRIPLAA